MSSSITILLASQLLEHSSSIIETERNSIWGGSRLAWEEVCTALSVVI